MRAWLRFGAVLGAAFLAVGPALAADRILVFAAASLKEALDDADAAYGKKTGVTVDASYAASGPLAKQIENAAPADIFISADLDWMNELAKKQLIRPETRADLLGNSLVLIGAATDGREVNLAPKMHFAPLLGDGRLAIGDPQSVPAGKYAQQALESLGTWDEVEPHLARAESVRAALALVSRGEAPLGIVYKTDAMADKGVRTLAPFAETTHPPIVYPAAVVAASTNKAAGPFLTWLESAEAATYFTQRGFTVKPRAGDDPPGVAIAGKVAHPATLTPADLAAMKQVSVDVSFATGHGQESGHYTGALLWDVVDKAGFADSDGRHHLRLSIVVTGRDGYAVALSVGEISPDFEAKQVILAADGKDGIRLIVPGDH
ncbi:MAG TPA: molybdate ABC transporter substrate-binding protein, partial [Stellaceae bacterium]|nr:molybdate ABC transporter substrate-binding protein [Stellaceae bacterium]